MYNKKPAGDNMKREGSVMVEPRLALYPGVPGYSVGRPKIGIGSPGPVSVGGKTVICHPRLCGSSTVAVWSKAMYGNRAKIAGGTAGLTAAGLSLSGDCGRFVRHRQWPSKGQYWLRNACG